jgi:drug/metabolite transporter (DMT)-like permease
MRQGVRMWPQGREWRDIAVLGVPNMLLWHTYAILGVQALPSGRASTLGFTMPVWTVVLGAVFMGVASSWRSAAAVVAALAGIGLLISHELSALQGQPMGVLWMELGAISWGLGTLLMRRVQSTLPVQALTVWMMLLSSPFIFLAALGTEVWQPWALSTWGWVSVAYAVLINYGFAQIIWFGMARELPALMAGKTVKPFVYTDQGSLVSLSDYSSVGSLMGSLSQGSFFVEGQVAKLMYWALHKQHQLALGGIKKTALITLSEMIDRTHRPRIKLH